MKGMAITMGEIVFETISICKVIEGWQNDYNKHRLKRIYDIDEKKGSIHKVFLEDRSHNFDNRDWIYKYDGPNELGDIGAWYWSARPGENNPEMDYIQSSFRADIQLIYIKVLENVNSLDTLLSELRTGIELGFDYANEEQWMILYKAQSGQYEGVYCEKGSLESNGYLGENGRLKQSVVRLQSVSIDAGDIFRLDNRRIYRFLHVDPLGEVMTRSVNDVVRNCILDLTTWKAFSEFIGGTRSERRLFKDFLSSIETDIYQDVAKQCGCDESTAIEYVEKFVKIANTYIEGTDVETEVLTSLVDGNAEIRDRVEAIVEDKWIENNKKRIGKAEEELNSINAKRKDLEDEINRIRERQKEEKKQYQEDIDSQEKILRDLEARINVRMSDFNDSLGEMLADSVYYNNLVGTATNKKKPTVVFESGVPVAVEGNPEGVQQVADYLSCNLEEAGVSEGYLDIISAFLTSAVYNRMPIILAGPNGRAIADAISISIFGKTAGCCRCWTGKELLESIETIEDEVICIEDLCKDYLIDLLPDIVGHTDKVIILLTPYYENLFVEPSGLYSYALPLMTEWFVDISPRKNWCGGEAINDWNKDIRATPIRKNILSAMQNIGMKMYQKTMYTRILGVASAVLDHRGRDLALAYVTGLIPYAVATGNIDKLIDFIEQDESLDKDNRNELLTECGVQ